MSNLPIPVEQKTEADALLEFAVEHGYVQPVKLGNGHEAVAVPNGRTLESLKKLADEYLLKPERRRGVAQLESLQSFCAHVNRFNSDASAVFLHRDATAPVLRAVYDYHPAGPVSTAADWCEHGAAFTLKPSQEWTAWMAAHTNDRGFTLPEFGVFLEERLADVYGGEASESIAQAITELQLKRALISDLVRASRSFAVNVSTEVKDVRVLDTGEVSLTYDEKHRGGGETQVSVPNACVIAIPVFAGTDAYQVLVRLSYRVSQQGVRWFVRLSRPDLVRRAALDLVAVECHERVQLPVFDGVPEAVAR
jgi:uncharacterized protein YfdQ (DUF2303 family)